MIMSSGKQEGEMLELRKFFQVVKHSTMLQIENFNEKKQLFFYIKKKPVQSMALLIIF